MKKMKKLSVILIALVLILSALVLVACNKSVKLSFMDGDATVDSLEVKGGSEVELPTLSNKTVDGQVYVFEGWSSNSDASGELLRGKTTAPKSNATYYAKWSIGHKLTFVADGDVLDSNGAKVGADFALYLYEGAPILDFVKDYTATHTEGRAFGAWFIGDSRVGESTTMPGEDVTVTAHYQVNYTVRYFLQNQDSTYTEDLSLKTVKTGTAGDVVGADGQEIAGYMYYPDHEDAVTRIVLADIDSFNELRCYYDIDGYHVRYRANAPSGTVATGTMSESILSADKISDVKAAECGYAVEGYRFLGWGESAGSKTVKYRPGNALTISSKRYNLYAIWDQGYADAIGGGDYLFFHADEPTSIYLQRKGIEEKKGDYDPNTQIFSFKEGTKTILSGKITGHSFYYFNSTMFATYKSDTGKETLTVGEEYKATFSDGTEHQGTLEYDPDWGYYVFNGANDFVRRFVFLSDDEGNIVFKLQDMELAGYYATEKGYPVIYLDGLGSFRYYFDPEHPDYVDQVTGEGLLEAFGIYSVNEDGYYFCEMYTGDMDIPDNHREDFLFRMLEGKKPAAVSGYDLKDTAIERSTLYGQLSTELYLDGFGGGVYTPKGGEPKQGTYKTLHNWWMTEDTRTTLQVWLINFAYDGATEDIYFAIMQDNYGTVTAALFGTATKDLGGLAIFDGAITIAGENYSDAFIMYIVGGHNVTMIMVKIDEGDLSTGETVSIYAPMYSGTVTYDAATKVYHYEDTKISGAQMNFKLKADGKAEYLAEGGGGTLETQQIAPGLTIDPNTSTATYTEGGKTYNDVHYTYSHSEILEFYTFDISETQKLYYYRDVINNANDFVKISANRLLNYSYYSEDLANAYPARLLLAEGSDNAYLAIPMAIGEASFVGFGKYEKVGATEYHYKNNRFVSGLLDFFGGDGFTSSLEMFEEYYTEFTFRAEYTEGSAMGSFYERDDDLYFTLDNFKSDGYDGVATYTTDDGATLKGTFYRMEIIIVFEGPDKDYYLKEDSAKNRMKTVSEDAGIYYFYNPDDTFFETFGPNSGTSYSDYIIYDGEGNATVVTFTDGVLPEPKNATMTQTDKWSKDFREYQITEIETLKSYNVLLGVFTTLWDESFDVYDVYNAAYFGDWRTEENGRLHGDGYRIHPATYDMDGDGNADLTGLMVRAEFSQNDIQTHAYTESARGSVIVFTYNVTEEQTASYVFDIIPPRNYLKERKLIFGAFAEWEAGKRSGAYIYLDGQGNATLYNSLSNRVGTGTYKIEESSEEYTYYSYVDDVNQNANFKFAIYIESESSGMTYFEYRKYNGDVNGEYNGDDWSHLSVNSFGEITYTDHYGVVYEGYYAYDAQKRTLTLYTFDGTGITFVFRFNSKTATFELVQ